MHWRRRASRLCWVFFPVRVSCRPLAAVLVNPKASSSSRYASSPVSLVTVEPWNSNLIWRSKSTRRGSFWQSPIRFLGQRGGESTETLGFPEDRRKRHAKTTESSGKSGFRQADGRRSYRNQSAGRLPGGSRPERGRAGRRI